MSEKQELNDGTPIIEVFADIACPFAYVGLRHLIRARDKRGFSARLVVRAWPLELINDGGSDPEKEAATIDALRSQLEPELFTGFNPATFPRTSIPAFGLAHAAYERDVETGESVSIELRKEIFESGRDVSEPAVLHEIAERFGLVVPSLKESESIARADWEEGQRRGVVGSPHFFLPDGSDAFNPGLQVDHRDDGTVGIDVDLRGMSKFFAPAFS